MTDSPVKTAFMSRNTLKRDLKFICDIEDDNFEHPYTFNDFSKNMKLTKVTCHTIEIKEKIAGYFIYSVVGKHICILKLCLSREFQRQGIGSAVIKNLQLKMKKFGVTILSVLVPSNMLYAQLFFKKLKFKCDKIVNLENGEEYLFTYCDNLTED